jgi:hypothetical protein
MLDEESNHLIAIEVVLHLPRKLIEFALHGLTAQVEEFQDERVLVEELLELHVVDQSLLLLRTIETIQTTVSICEKKNWNMSVSFLSVVTQR